jgi:hypothetical protein
MNVFIKTLIGDVRNLSCVGLLVVTAAVLVGAGQGVVAPYVIPPLTLACIAWLARG